MADPMTRGKLQELLSDMECGVGPDSGDIMDACDDLIAQERAAARAEAQERAEEIADFERTRDELAAARRQAEEDRDDALREAERLRAELADAREEERRQRETAEAASRGWRNEVDEVEKLHAERDQLRRTVAGWRDSYERLSRQLLRRHFAWQSARRGREQARAQAERLREERTRTVDALTDVGRTAEEASGDLESAINAELLALAITADTAEAAVQRVRECVASASWEHALVKARDIRRALDGTEAAT